LMRSPQPSASMRVALSRVRVSSLGALRGRVARSASGLRRRAQSIGFLFAEGLFATVLGVAIVRVNMEFVVPGRMTGGLKEAVARLGRPVAARVMGLERLPWNAAVKVKLAELPERMVCEVVPMEARVKSGVGPVEPAVMSSGVETLEAKLVLPAN
jgi:hypothetical protein